MTNKFEEGYEAFFNGASYKDNKDPAWLNGWTNAERISRCGWYDRSGRPSEINKAVR